VAFRADDERFVALGAHVARVGRAALPFWRLQERLSAVLWHEKGLKPNIALGAAAMLLDMGFTAEQAQAITNLANVNTFYANAIEGARDRSRLAGTAGGVRALRRQAAETRPQVTLGPAAPLRSFARGSSVASGFPSCRRQGPHGSGGDDQKGAGLTEARSMLALGPSSP
jgi:hypothetical protein